jgi:alginate O-acetyltransferase complex protein AlgJ
MSPSPTEDHLRDGQTREVDDSKDNIQPVGAKVARHRRRPRIPALPLAAALLFFFGPAIAFAFGDRAHPIENRPLARMPSLDSGWQAIPGFNAWAIDNLPLRSPAVRAYAELSEAVFGEPPLSGNHTTSGIGSLAAGNAPPDSAAAKPSILANRVIQGKDDWLYIIDDFSAVCNPQLSLPTVIDGLKRLHTAIEASGRKLVISVIPDKSTAVPQNLPENFAYKNCGEERRKEFWQEMVASKVPFIDLRKPLAEAARAAQHPMYLKLNTHWNIEGAAVWTKSVLAALDGRLIEGLAIPGVDAWPLSGESSFVAGPELPAQGDLTVMLGAPRNELTPQIALRRKGVTLTSDGVPLPGNVPPPIVGGPAGKAARPAKCEASTTAAPVYPGHTLILGDSFYDSPGVLAGQAVYAGALFAPFMATLTADYALADPASFTQDIIDADTVVMEVAERSLSSGGVPLSQPNALAELERSLATHHR